MGCHARRTPVFQGLYIRDPPVPGQAPYAYGCPVKHVVQLFPE